MNFKQKENEDVMVINCDEIRNAPAPEIGKIYKCFDDGKIRLNRLDYWRIDEAIDLDNDVIDPELLDMLKEGIDNCYWLYSPEQHIIYKATMVNKDGSVYRYDGDDGPQECYFIRTKNGEWFGLDFFLWDGLLYVDDYYYNKYLNDCY